MSNYLRVADRERFDPETELRTYAAFLRANHDTRAYITGTPAERADTRAALVRMGVAAHRIIEVG